MAVPTISAVDPTSGPAGGRSVVTITGTNFRTPDAPPATGPVQGTRVIDVVRVRIGGEDARSVDIVSSTELQIEAPAYRGDTEADPILAADVVVTNLDNDGDPISGETVTSSSAYTYVRPSLRPPGATGDLDRYRNVVNNVVAVFRRQVLKNTRLANVSTDFAEASVTITHVASLPSIALSGPSFEADPWRSTHHTRTTFNTGTGRYDAYYPPYTYMLEFTLLGLAESQREAINLAQSVVELFQRNGYLEVDVVPSDPAQGREQFPFVLTDPPSLTPGTAGSNMHTFTAEFQVRGVDFELPQPFDETSSVDEIDGEFQQKEGSPGVETKEL